MKEIYVLEHFDFDEEQMKTLKSLGNVHYFQKATKEQIDKAIANADAVLLDRIDPNPILKKMKKGQFICLPYTGFDWIKNLNLAKQNGVVVSNTPNYSTNAVAEHHLSLILDCAKHITSFNNAYKNFGGGAVPFNRGFELKGKTVGIIGLGNIGRRLSELLQGFGVQIVTHNRTPKSFNNIKDVDLQTLLKSCDTLFATLVV